MDSNSDDPVSYTMLELCATNSKIRTLEVEKEESSGGLKQAEVSVAQLQTENQSKEKLMSVYKSM